MLPNVYVYLYTEGYVLCTIRAIILSLALQDRFFRLQRYFESTNVLAFVHKKFDTLLGGLGEREEDEKS